MCPNQHLRNDIAIVLVSSTSVLQNCIAQGSRLATGLCNRPMGVPASDLGTSIAWAYDRWPLFEVNVLRTADFVCSRSGSANTRFDGFFLRFCFCILSGFLGPPLQNVQKFYPSPLLTGDLLEWGSRPRDLDRSFGRGRDDHR
jgi:hypothetical protein